MNLCHGICGLKKSLITHVLRIITIFERTKEIKKCILWQIICSIFKFEYQKILCLQRERNGRYNIILQDLDKKQFSYISKMLCVQVKSKLIRIFENMRKQLKRVFKYSWRYKICKVLQKKYSIIIWFELWFQIYGSFFLASCSWVSYITQYLQKHKIQNSSSCVSS